MDRAAYLRAWSGLHGGYDPAANAFVRGWLTVAHALGSPLARAGVSPNLLTGLGVLLAGMAVLVVGDGRPALLVAASALVVASALLDGLDGAVAVIAGRTSRLGAVLDSTADRLSDLLLLAALWQAGADPLVCVLAGGATFFLEYVRARATVAGLDDVGVITVGERPSRVIVVVAGLLTSAVLGGDWLTPTAAAVAGLTLVGAVQLFGVAFRRLR